MGRLGWVVGLEVALISIVAAFYLPGGDDLYSYYLPLARGCMKCAFVPYHAYYLLYPLGLLPDSLAWPVVVALFWATVGLICWHRQVNPMWVALSFPALGQVWLGQVDFIVMLGLFMLTLPSWGWQSFGLILAMIKPQLSIIPVIFFLWQSRAQLGRLLALPVLVLLISLAQFGFWPLQWLDQAKLPDHVWRLSSQVAFPYGLTLLPFVAVMGYELTLLLPFFASPYPGVYSYVIFLPFFASPSTLILSYAWLIFYPFWGLQSLAMAGVLPLTAIFLTVYDSILYRYAHLHRHTHHQ